MKPIELNYIQETGQIEIIDYNGYPTYIPFSDLVLIDANERQLGTETEYVVMENIHIIFYPEGVLLDWYID